MPSQEARNPYGRPRMKPEPVLTRLDGMGSSISEASMAQIIAAEMNEWRTADWIKVFVHSSILWPKMKNGARMKARMTKLRRTQRKDVDCVMLFQRLTWVMWSDAVFSETFSLSRR